MDITLELNTGDIGYNTFISEIVTGELKAVIIQSDEILGTDLEIFSELGYLVFRRYQNRGNSYIPIKNQVFTPENQLLTPASSSFYLNEPLKLIVRGNRNTPIKIILRLE